MTVLSPDVNDDLGGFWAMVTVSLDPLLWVVYVALKVALLAASAEFDRSSICLVTSPEPLALALAPADAFTVDEVEFFDPPPPPQAAVTKAITTRAPAAPARRRAAFDERSILIPPA